MRDHWWWRPGWRVGRRAYAFHITFDEDTAVLGLADLRRVASDYQRAIETLPALDPVPLHWLHLTMQNVGFTDEVSETDAQAVLDGARELCRPLRPFELSFGPVEVRGEGIALTPSPFEPVAQLRDAVRTAIGAVCGTVPEAPEHAHGFEPHVSLAYSNSEAPSVPVTSGLEAVAVLPVVVTVLAAKLIVLDRDERGYRWTTIGPVALGEST